MLTMKRHPRTRATNRVQPRQRGEPIGIAGRVSATLAASLLAMLPVRHAIAHAGDLDPSFGNGGIVIVPNLRADAPFDEATAVAIQPDGKIVVAGRWGGTGPGPTFAIVRFDADGSLDGTFGVDGIVTLSSGFAGGDEAHGVAIAGDGKITVGGYFGSLGGVYRLESDGSLDGGFGSAGSVVVAANGDSGHRTTINSLVLDGFGGTLVAGDYFGSGHGEYMLGWLAADGTILSAVPVSLVVPDRDQIATALVHQADGKVVVGGYADLTDIDGYDGTYCAVARFTPTAFPSVGFVPDPDYGYGPETFFAIDTTATSCYADTLALLPDGSTLPAGREFLTHGTWIGMYARLDTSGTFDSTFGGMPQLSSWGDNSIRSIAIQSDGKPVLVGYTGVDASGVPGPFAMRLTTAGRPDATYGNNGETLIDFDPQDYA